MPYESYETDSPKKLFIPCMMWMTSEWEEKLKLIISSSSSTGTTECAAAQRGQTTTP